jgi:hypothetical protein
MLLLIVFVLSSHVLCTIRDESLTRLVLEGFEIADEVMARDSRGFERVVSQFRGPKGPLVDVVPSWLLGGEDGTSVEIRLGGRGRDITLNSMMYHIQGSDNWFISYARPAPRLADLHDLGVNELLRDCPYTLPFDVLYFSRPDPDTDISWVYTIVDYGPHRRMLGGHLISPWSWMMYNQLSLRQKSNIIEAITEWSLRLRRRPYINVSAPELLLQSVVHPNREFVMAMNRIPDLNLSVPKDERSAVSFVDILADIAYVIQSLGSTGTYMKTYQEEILRHALFLYSESPEPVVDEEGHQYDFISLEQVRGDEFLGYHASQLRSCLVEFVDEFRRAWDTPDDDTKILSIVERIERLPQEYLLK